MSIIRKNDGFTLIEILVAIGMLIVALLGMASVTVMVIKGNSYGKHVTTATTLVNDKLEQLKNTSYNSLAGGTDYAKIDSTVQTTQAADSIYTRTWNVADTMNATNTKSLMKTITLTVTWSWAGQTRNMTMKTIIANLN